jgi:cyclase
LIKSVSTSISIPVVALGGAGNIKDLSEAHRKGYANGLGAGSLFIYHGKNRGVLINYPEKDELKFE